MIIFPAQTEQRKIKCNLFMCLFDHVLVFAGCAMCVCVYSLVRFCIIFVALFAFFFFMRIFMRVGFCIRAQQQLVGAIVVYINLQ